ncbi:MAG: hypothetical protein HY707_11625 [Ignavibacteriae bacterium]|nr:hypothetical protein [Ignavibacteriota bacterium]
MNKIKILVCVSAIIVLGICIYSFLGGNGVFNGEFKNEYIAWYFLAKGIFCSLALYLLVRILETFSHKSVEKKVSDIPSP